MAAGSWLACFCWANCVLSSSCLAWAVFACLAKSASRWLASVNDCCVWARRSFKSARVVAALADRSLDKLASPLRFSSFIERLKTWSLRWFSCSSYWWSTALSCSDWCSKSLTLAVNAAIVALVTLASPCVFSCSAASCSISSANKVWWIRW